jgi:hypothetical protein
MNSERKFKNYLISILIIAHLYISSTRKTSSTELNFFFLYPFDSIVQKTQKSKINYKHESIERKKEINK